MRACSAWLDIADQVTGFARVGAAECEVSKLRASGDGAFAPAVPRESARVDLGSACGGGGDGGPVWVAVCGGVGDLAGKVRDRFGQESAATVAANWAAPCWVK
jgi:hypothetical protein